MVDDNCLADTAVKATPALVIPALVLIHDLCDLSELAIKVFSMKARYGIKHVANFTSLLSTLHDKNFYIVFHLVCLVGLPPAFLQADNHVGL
jgi:hypothetical protein